MATRTETDHSVMPLLNNKLINIGSHPGNDLVITDEGVQPFHALLDCRETPYTLVPLSLDGEITLNGLRAPSYQVLQISDNDTISLGNHRLRLLPASGSSPLRLAIASGQNTAEDAGTRLETADVDISGPTQDDIILASLDKNTAEVSVDQTAIFVLTLGNGSPIVSTFHVQVDGIPDEWVLVSPANVNLNEGARGIVTIEITPPRRPSSTAGEHTLRFTITSHNHPDRRVTLPVTLTIQPYFEYGISDLTPQRRKVGWRQKSGLVQIDITNRGNNASPFLLGAQDEENSCRFQFTDQDGLKQPGQVQYSIPPGATHTAQLHISPVKRRLVQMRAQSYPYRVVSSQPENPAMTLFTTGTAIIAPLINALGLLIILALLVCTTAYLFTPRISYFLADSNLIGVGESTTLRWKTSPFTHNVSITGVDKAISGSQGALQIFPGSTVNTYSLSASTWLWALLGLTPRSAPVTVMAVPGEPVVSTFTLSSQDALVGDEVTLRWSVDNTDKLLLTINGVTETFEDKKDFNGERKLTIEKATLVSLKAQNTSATVVKSQFITVQQPSIEIDRFELSKNTITTGDQVTISWKVSGVGMDKGGEVTISAFDSVLPLEGQMTFFPKESMEFVLTARNRKLQESRILPVGVLAPDAPPKPPTIDFFTAAPDSLVGPGKVELSWSVSGAFDNIKISNGTDVVADKLGAQGFRSISVANSGTYVLTATNVDKTAGGNLKITVNPALIKPILKIASVYPEDNLEMGDFSVVSVDIANPKKDDAPPTGKIMVTDGTSSCVIDLPKTNCKLEFETPGLKRITASYQGDTLHVQTVSDPYTKQLNVMGNTITLVANVLPVNLVYNYNQKITVRLLVNGTNPSRVPDGELRIRRICDTSGAARYTCDCSTEVIGYHKLTPADSGSHKFTDLTIDQVGGKWGLQINFSGDSFYNPADQVAELSVDNTPRPVVLELATASSTPGQVGKSMTYTVTATDDNPAGVYVTPEGSVTLIATHSDGVTSQRCSNVTLVPNGDGRRSSATCSITPSKWGAWTMSAVYTVATSTDIIHTNTTTTFPDLVVNSNALAAIRTAPGDIVYGTYATVEIDIVRSEDPTQFVTTGTLACSFPSGVTDGSCSCLYSSGSTWTCTLRPAPQDALPANKTITFNYSPGSNTYLNPATLTRTVSIQKAGAVANISALPQATYQVASTYTFLVNVAHATSGGPAPTSGKVTAILGTGSCSATDGMKTGVVNTSTVDLGTSHSFTFENSQLNKTLTVCYRYDGDNSHYSASNYVATPAFTIIAQSTTASIATQPNASYLVGETYSITVTATRSSGTSTVTQGDTTIQLGTGVCDAANGMTSGILNSWTNTVGAARNIVFSQNHVQGQDLRFCVRYNGNGTDLSPSSWVASNAVRVRAVPTWSATANVEVAASQNRDVATSFSVVLNNAYSPIQSHVQVVLNDANSTVLCPSSPTDTEKVCSLTGATTSADGKATTYTFSFATNIANTWTASPRYLSSLSSTDVDPNNTDATGSTFTIHSYYDISIAGVSTTVGSASGSNALYAYTDKEQSTGDTMSTTLSTTVTVANFTNFDFTTGLRAVASAEQEGTGDLPLDPTSGPCSITNTSSAGVQVGAVSCPLIRVSNSVIDRFRITLIPDNSSLFGTNLSSMTESKLIIIQNVIEQPSDAAYSIKVENGLCGGADLKQQIYNISGYAAGTGNPAIPLLASDFTFMLTCENSDDGDANWDDTFVYSSANSTFSQLTWDTSVTPPKFSFVLKGNSGSTGYSGCTRNADGVRFDLHISNDAKDFELASWNTGDTYLRDDKAGSIQAYDHCRDNK